MARTRTSSLSERAMARGALPRVEPDMTQGFKRCGAHLQVAGPPSTGPTRARAS